MMHQHSKPKESSGGSVYFQNSKNTELTELQSELNSMKLDQQKEAMKQIIASMTIGKDVSALFPHVVKCMRTNNIELKKLIYLYIINYAKAKPDLTLLAVAGFHTDALDKSSPLIRALAVRTMGCIRVNMIVSYLCETLKNCLKDEDAYVRKTATVCVAKLYTTSPVLVKENGFIDTLISMLSDGNALVVANSLAALTEISVLSGENLIKIRSKVLKRILLALNEANEWGLVYILDALTSFTPKKAQQAENIIESVLPRLSNVNPAVVMSGVKVILKFLDWIESIETVRNYCKKLSNSLMTIMMAGPEIQYVLLRSLHAVVQKRPNLLDKDFKYFYVTYTDPIYVKLEKIDILYKLCDNKNFESIINELKSYSLTEFDSDLVKRSIKYIGFIGFKFEKSLDLCVECMKEILDHNQEFTVSEGIIVARDLLRKYKGKSLELLKKIDEEFIQSVQEPEAKAALLFILGEFCNYIKNSTKLIAPFVETFNEETVGAVKLQILNSVIKNFVNKPEETEDLVKTCLQKGGEESENPDVRDRAFIYWRLLEINPDVAKEMITTDKPAFEFREEINFEGEIIDNIIENMTNMSAVYHKFSAELIPKEDMVVDVPEIEEPEKTVEGKEKKKPETGGKTKEETKKTATKKEAKNEINIMDADLLGLDDENPHIVTNNIYSNSQGGTMNISDILASIGGNFSPSPNNIQSNEVNIDDFGFVNDENNFNENNIDMNIFSNYNPGLTVPAQPNLAYKSNDITVYSSFLRDNSKVLLGLIIVNKTKANFEKITLELANNSFGLNLSNNTISKIISPMSSDKVIFQIENDNSKNDKKPPGTPYKIKAKLQTSNLDILLDIQLLVNVLLTESGKMNNNSFVEFFKNHRENTFNVTNVYNNLNNNSSNEDSLNKRFEKNNIFLVARQAKFDPPLLYYSMNVSGAIPVVLECSFPKSSQPSLKIKIIAGFDSIGLLVKEALDLILE